MDAYGKAMAWMVLGMLCGSFGAGTAAVLGLWWVWVIVVAIVVLSVVMYSVNLKKGLKE